MNDDVAAATRNAKTRTAVRKIRIFTGERWATHEGPRQMQRPLDFLDGQLFPGTLCASERNTMGGRGTFMAWLPLHNRTQA